jgi:hypothetical protein
MMQLEMRLGNWGDKFQELCKKCSHRQTVRQG